MSLPPLNRLVAFAGPTISLGAGAAATWIIARANALGIPGLEHSDLAQQIASGLTFGLTSLLVWLGQSKWLSGLQLWEQNEAMVQAAALAAPAPTPSAAAGIDPGHEALMELGEDLPDDETEFAPTVVDHAMVAEPAGVDDDVRPVMPSEIDVEGEPDEDEELAT